MKEQERRELVLYRMRLARETCSDARLLMDNGSWRAAANRLYYACFYAVCALLVYREHYPKTHKGTRQIFTLLYIKDSVIGQDLGEAYNELFDLRHSGDYADMVDVTEDDVRKLVEPTEELISTAERLLKEAGWL